MFEGRLAFGFGFVFVVFLFLQCSDLFPTELLCGSFNVLSLNCFVVLWIWFLPCHCIWSVIYFLSILHLLEKVIEMSVYGMQITCYKVVKDVN